MNRAYLEVSGWKQAWITTAVDILKATCEKFYTEDSNSSQQRPVPQQKSGVQNIKINNNFL